MPNQSQASRRKTRLARRSKELEPSFDCGEQVANCGFHIRFMDNWNVIFRDYVKPPLTRSFWIYLDAPITRDEVERRIAQVFGH